MSLFARLRGDWGERSVIIGDEEFLNTQVWRATDGGRKLIAR